MDNGSNKDNKKIINIVIVILIVSIILCASIYYALYSKRSSNTGDLEISEKNKDNNNSNSNNNNNKIDEGSKNSQKPIDDKHQENDNTTTQTTTTTTTKTTTTKKVESDITYYCPDGYTLIGKKCFSEIDANYVCPEGTHDYSNSEIPENTYCVNLNEGYESDSESCSDGYGILKIITIGAPSKYKCFPLHKKIYTCPDGYNLNNKKCTSIISASETNN